MTFDIIHNGGASVVTSSAYFKPKENALSDTCNQFKLPPQLQPNDAMMPAPASRTSAQHKCESDSTLEYGITRGISPAESTEMEDDSGSMTGVDDAGMISHEDMKLGISVNGKEGSVYRRMYAMTTEVDGNDGGGSAAAAPCCDGDVSPAR